MARKHFTDSLQSANSFIDALALRFPNSLIAPPRDPEAIPPIFLLRAHNDYIAYLKGGFLTVSVATMTFAQRCEILPLHRFHNESMQDCKNLARLRRSTLPSLQGSCSGKRLDLWNKKVDGVRTGSWMSSSRYDKRRRLSWVSTSRTTAVSSDQERVPPPMVLKKARLKRPTSRSNWPPHHGARLRLNCQWIPSFAV